MTERPLGGMEFHLDALGGMAGDMFAGAVLDAFPELESAVLATVDAVARDAHLHCRLLPHHDGVLQGRRFAVEASAAHHHHHGEHRSWATIRATLEAAPIEPTVREHAIAIFGHLAEAEAKVHGIDTEEVTFHEVGAWDSIADIVAAATLIAALGPARWTVGPLPLGGGRTQSAHGWLPLPAPATVLLLRGFATTDDGVAGERVTPTGAAILRHLCPPGTSAGATPRRLGRTGIGFGTRTLPGMPNCVRLLAFEGAEAAPGHRQLGVIEFEVDDQSAEDLATGLDRLRAADGVHDVVQTPVFGKKGRMMAHVRLLVRTDAMDAAIAACFRETTTIGLRHHLVDGAALARRSDTVEVAGHAVRVKRVERPGGATAKAEADDVRTLHTHGARAAARRDAEQLVLAEGDAP